MSYTFDLIDFDSYVEDEKYPSTNISNSNYNSNKDDNNCKMDKLEIYDKTTCETYKIKRLYKIDPITDSVVPENLEFKFYYKWNPYNGSRIELDEIGPLYFNAIDLYQYYFINRYKGLWIKPENGFEGMYGDIVGGGKKCNIKSRGDNPEKYLFRLPIIDCYLPPTHKMSIITMGPELTEEEINEIDSIILKYHPNKSNSKFTSLSKLKHYYDQALETQPDPECIEIKELKNKYQDSSEIEINYRYNRIFVDKLVNLKL